MLALLGGSIGMLFCAVVVGYAAIAHGRFGVRRWVEPAPSNVSMDLRVLIYAVALTLATGILFGLAPALRSARSGEASLLREEGLSRADQN